MEKVHFIFCDINGEMCKEWRKQIATLTPEQQSHFSIFHDRLSEYTGTFDCIVSPANSYARLDGSFDAFISRMFSPDAPSLVSDHCQEYLHAIYNGYQAPGTCLLIPMIKFFPNEFSCRYIAHCPTMRMPSDCRWNKEVVYNCMWNLLCELNRHNKYHTGEGQRDITTVLVTGLGTGVGNFPFDTCAKQMIFAYKHYLYNLAKERPLTSWRHASNFDLDIEETRRTTSMFQWNSFSSDQDESAVKKNDWKMSWKEKSKLIDQVQDDMLKDNLVL
jgi:O-acetyl-ADP-ribose deacetylase (regulator of RNase III)